MSASKTLSFSARPPVIAGFLLPYYAPAAAVDQRTHTVSGHIFEIHLVVRSAVSKLPGFFDLFVVIDKVMSVTLFPFEVVSAQLSIALNVWLGSNPSANPATPTSQRATLLPISVPIDVVSITTNSVYFKSFEIPAAGRASRLTFISATISFHTVVDAGRKNAFFLSPTLDNPNLCDDWILPKDSQEPIFVSRAILSQASSFFAAMFDCPAAAGAQHDSPNPIPFDWSSHAVVACLIHIYTDWLPEQPLPNSKTILRVCEKYALDFGGSNRDLWLETNDLANMLGLMELAKVTNRLVKSIMNQENQGLLAAGASEIPGEWFRDG